MKQPKPKKCLHCGTLFEVKRFLQTHCSPKCTIAHTKEHTKGWGKRPVINSKPLSPMKVNSVFAANSHALRQELKEESGGSLRCERCGIYGHRIETHHIIFRSEKPNHEFLHDKRNLICLCSPCHNFYHEVKGRRDQIVAERKLNLLFGEDVLNKSKS